MKDELSGKRLVVLGLARQGKALASFAARVGAEIVVSDLRTSTQLEDVLDELEHLNLETILGEHPLELLDDADLLAVSGGVPADLPLVLEAKRRGIPITNDSLEFIKRAPAPVIGITGSAGKTTTTALCGAMGEASSRRTWVGGNIGRPLISQVEEMGPGDVIVQELSSFQLEWWNKSPQIAAVLNLTPNHLDRHKDLAAYESAKANILRHQKTGDVAVLSADDPGAYALRKHVRGRLRLFSQLSAVEDGAYLSDQSLMLRDGERETHICTAREILLRGRHNLSNVLAAIVLADSDGLSQESLVEGIRNFRGVEHRLEPVRTIDNVSFINDSIATAPERAMAAIVAFNEPIILLAGGRDKNMVWESWAKLVNQHVKAVILFGELGPALEEVLAEGTEERSRTPLVTRVDTMGEAVITAARIAGFGDVVLLSPGGTSFDAYTDFAERGREFRRIVYGLPGRSHNKHSRQGKAS